MFFGNEENVLELLGVFKIKREKNTHKSINGRVYDSLSIRLRGNSEFSYDGKISKIMKNDILYIPQNVSYSQSTYGEEIIAIHFINYNPGERNGIEIFSFKDYKQIRDIMLKMYSVWNEKKTGYKMHCMSMLYEILYMVNEQKIKDSVPYNSAMSEAVNYIHRNYKKEQILISDLAKMCCVSETYFRRIFKSTYSVSPLRYITNLKLEYASQLLLARLYTIPEVSEMAGFSDSKYFSRVFKKKYGKCPKEYKKM